jgi:AAR2 protein
MDSKKEYHDMESLLSPPEKRKSLFAMIELPIGSVMTLNGSAIVLQRADFVGIHSFPDHGFHALMVRGGSLGMSERMSEDTTNRRSNPSSATVGFVFLGSNVKSDDPIFIRRFDRHTEEISSSPVDMETQKNLRHQFEHGQIDPCRLLAYDQVVPTSQHNVWRRLTGFISRDLLDLRVIRIGEKLVPGAYCPFDEDPTSTAADEILPQRIDGRCVSYPPIPMFPLNARRHMGTRQFLQSLTPAMRTAISCDCRSTNTASTVVLEYLLSNVYRRLWKCLLGDLQLAFVLFLNLQCYSSWIHWRDLLSMLSFVNSSDIQRYLEPFSLLFTVLSVQIETIDERDIVDGVDVTEKDGFFIPSMQRLLDSARIIPALRRNEPFLEFRKVLHDKFPAHFSDASVYQSEFHRCSNYNSPEAVVSEDGTGDFRVSDRIPCEIEDDDSDALVVVALEEVEESLARSRLLFTETLSLGSTGVLEHSREWLRDRYPFLLAAMDSSSYKEDIVMTCARVLYDASDVSLVREAAAYLEEVEAQSTHF